MLSLQSLKVAVDGGDENGLLVLDDAILVAVLVCLEEASYGPDQHRWHLEAGFGSCAIRSTTFARLEEALLWIAARRGVDPGEAMICAQAHLGQLGGHLSH